MQVKNETFVYEYASLSNGAEYLLQFEKDMNLFTINKVQLLKLC